LLPHEIPKFARSFEQRDRFFGGIQPGLIHIGFADFGFLSFTALKGPHLESCSAAIPNQSLRLHSVGEIHHATRYIFVTQINEPNLMPDQLRALKLLLNALPGGEIFVLKAAASGGRTAITRHLHAEVGGVFIGIRDVMQSLEGRDPLAIEEASLATIERALEADDLAIVDDLHLVVNFVNRYGAMRLYLLEAALTAIMGNAVNWGKRLVFGVEDVVPWPVQRRAHTVKLAGSRRR
jgi:hypothetical protein